MRLLAVAFTAVVLSLAATLGPAQPPTAAQLERSAPGLFPHPVLVARFTTSRRWSPSGTALGALEAKPAATVTTEPTTGTPVPPPVHYPTSPSEPTITVPAPIPAPEPSVAPVSDFGGSDATSVDTPDWECIGFHESGNSYTEAGGGRWQFEDGTFTAVTGLPEPAQDYPPAVQDVAALKLFSEALRVYGDGFHPWTTRWVCGLG